MREGHIIRKSLQVQFNAKVAREIENLRGDGRMRWAQSKTVEQLEPIYDGILTIIEVKQLKALLDCWMHCDLDIYSINQEGK